MRKAGALEMLRKNSCGASGILAAVVFLLCCIATHADDAEFFESRIRPLLIARCYECHSAATEQNGGLALDSKPGWEQGGDSGSAIVSGDPESSRLIKAVRWNDADLKMPPEDAGGKLATSEIADLEAWVRAGAFDPRIEAPVAKPRKSWAETFEERRAWWSLQPVQNPNVPEVTGSDWNVTAIDRFLFDRMTKAGLEPAALAAPETLIRRATLILTGLPPTVEDVTAFVAASQTDRNAAYEKLVDRLLVSPYFGERFARHWMDVVRFTETHGNEWNYDVPYAWRYRDYLIRAFNDDVPYDRFVREHVAGDLLAEIRWSPDGRLNESVIGTAFYRFGEVNHDSCVLFGSIGYDIADSQVDTLTKAFQATTVACARCHDHKLDAVSTKDYHALLGVLRSSRSVQHTLDEPDVNAGEMQALQELKVELRRELADVWRHEAAAINAQRLNAIVTAAGTVVPGAAEPLAAWYRVAKLHGTNGTPETNENGGGVAATWSAASEEYATDSEQRVAFNKANFTTLADFRGGEVPGWNVDGMGLRDAHSRSGDFTVAIDGDAAVRNVLPSGVFTFALSDKLNGAFRSPSLKRTHGKVSFEVIGGGFSLARIVFNNCQLNYTNQHSIHHPDWSWVTVDFQENTDELHPYAELLTFWDNPKFPDPLGTLSKDTENQRLPFSEHSKNPRTWWGVRKVVAHDGAETPKDEAAFVAKLYEGEPAQSLDQAAVRYSQIAAEAVEAFAANTVSDDHVRWLEWLLKNGLLSNKADAAPRLASLVAEYRQVEGRLSLPRTMPGMADEGETFPQPVLARGDYTKPGELVEARYLEAIQLSMRSARPGSAGKNIDLNNYLPRQHGGGRAVTAEAIADEDNPLTARVMVNRIWQWTFGSGLVRTPDNFGQVGDLPSHPELLDHLATRFMDEEWSMKTLIRSLVLSRAFQSSGAPAKLSRVKDPDNMLLSWYPARRAEAEVIRDSILAVSGRLDATQFGPSIHPFRATADTEKRLYTGPLDGDGRRSVYIKFQLMEPPSFLSAFNLPGGKETQGRRDASNVPAQSLALLNDPFVLAMADYWATRLVMENSDSTIAARAEHMFRRALGRSPNTAELARFAEAIENFAGIHGIGPAEIMTSKAVWNDAAHALFNFKEFIFVP